MLENNRDLLSNFPSFSVKEQKWVKDNLTKDLVDLVIEICGNTLCKNIEFSERDKPIVKKYKKQMHSVLFKQKTLSQRKRVIQRGGFLPQILALMGPPIISYLLSKIPNGAEKV